MENSDEGLFGHRIQHDLLHYPIFAETMLSRLRKSACPRAACVRTRANRVDRAFPSAIGAIRGVAPTPSRNRGTIHLDGGGMVLRFHPEGALGPRPGGKVWEVR